MFDHHHQLFLARGKIVPMATLSPSQFDRPTRSYTGAVYNQHGHLEKLSRRQNDDDWKRSDPPRITRGGPSASIPSATYLGHLFCHFGHFLIETLPQLYWTQRYKGPYVFHAWRDMEDRPERLDLPYVRHCLDVLNIPTDHVEIVTDCALAVDRLYLPPRGNPIGALPDRKTLKIYRLVAERTMRQLPDTGIRKAYLSRRGFKTDRGNNEADVEAEFKARGFTVIHPETLPFAEQVALISRCDVIAGLNGSAMHLGVFLKHGARQINLGPRGWKVQAPIARALGVQGDMLPRVAPWKAEDRQIDTGAIVSWLDAHGETKNEVLEQRAGN